MPIVPLQIPPGIERNGSSYDTPNRWWDMNLVRWQSGTAVPVGGWERVTGSALTGAIRNFHTYRDNSDQARTLVGTDSKLYTDTGGFTDITPAAFVPLSSIGVNGGYGTLDYGENTYGTARPTPSQLFSPYAFWSFDNWGEDVILTANSDGRLFYYDTSVTTTAPAVITTAPTGNNSVLVTSERHVMAIGQSGGTGGSLYRVAWSSAEDYTDWDFASTTNTAGFQDLDAHTPLLKGVEVREGTLILSQTDAYLAQYVGRPFIYGFTRISDASLLNPNTLVMFNGNAAWMGRTGFQLYSGGTVSFIDCPILNDIRNELDPLYGPFRAFGCVNGYYPEIWWFYPTTDETECNRYVIWNYGENWWAWGSLTRSAMAPGSDTRKPLMGTIGGEIFRHETGYTAAGSPRYPDIYLESGALPVNDGIVDINSIRAATGVGAQTLTVTAYSRYAPEGTEYTFGPYSPRSNGYTDTRISGSAPRLRFQPSSDAQWALGKVYLDVKGRAGARR